MGPSSSERWSAAFGRHAQSAWPSSPQLRKKRRILLNVRSYDAPVQTFPGHQKSHRMSSGSQPSLRISELLLPLGTYIVLYLSLSSSPTSTILFLLPRYFPTLNLYACYSFCPEWSSSRSFQDLFPHLIQVSPECHSWEAFPVLPPPKAATHPLPSLSQPFPLPCFLQNTITFSESIIHFFVHCLLPL